LASVVKHPELADYIQYMTLDEIAARPKGVMDLFEDGTLIIIKDFRLPFDFGAIEALDNRLDQIEDQKLRRKLKKLEATAFFDGKSPVTTRLPGSLHTTLRFEEPLRQGLFDTLCRGDQAIFENARRALKSAHDDLNRIFQTCFPQYRPTRLISSLRLTETLFENLHWDNHSIDDDFHQARVFCNIDRRKRVWNVGHRCVEYLESIYEEHDLGRFAGRDPNLMLNYVAGDVLGGTREIWKDNRPRHSIAFDPGEVWLGESRMISHQIWYGERAMVYMWFVDLHSMDEPRKRFNARVEALHERMQQRAPAVA